MRSLFVRMMLIGVIVIGGLVACAPQSPRVTTTIEQIRQESALLHAGITIAVAEFVAHNPTARVPIIAVATRLLQVVNADEGGDFGSLAAAARTRIGQLDVTMQEKIAMDALLTSLVPRVQAFAARYPQDVQVLALERDMLHWILDAAVLAGE